MGELGDHTPEQNNDAPEGHEDQGNSEDPDGSKDSNYLPPFEEEDSLGPEDFIIPEDPLEQEKFKRQLIATARSLKEKQQQLKAEQDTLNDRWTMVLAAEEDLDDQRQGQYKSYPRRRLLPEFEDEAFEPAPPK
jgi:hypothetical protein